MRPCRRPARLGPSLSGGAPCGVHQRPLLHDALTNQQIIDRPVPVRPELVHSIQEVDSLGAAQPLGRNAQGCRRPGSGFQFRRGSSHLMQRFREPAPAEGPIVRSIRQAWGSSGEVIRAS